MIPKIIHYCWFGQGEIPKKDRECIESWKRLCPDYKIIKWDESNYDIRKNKYMYEAYQNKKWGFVPDYARLDIIYNNGGIYLDTDVELVKSLDELLDNKAYMGFEKGGNYIGPGLGFGAEPKNKTIGELMKAYNEISFINKDGTLNLIPNPIINTKYFIKKGLKQNDKLQVIEDIKIYPSEYFCPMSYETGNISITPKTISIHRYNMSWVDPIKKKWHIRKQRLTKILGNKRANIIIKIISLPDRVVNKIKNEGIKKTLKFALNKFNVREKYVNKKYKNNN